MEFVGPWTVHNHCLLQKSQHLRLLFIEQYMNSNRVLPAKMATYHNIWKFLAKNTVSEINSKVPLFLELEFQKLEFLISFATVALLSWICAIKKNFAVLELGKLEYHLHSTRVYQARVPFFLKKNYVFFFLFLVWG